MPLFIEEVNSTEIDAAKALCGNNDACVFDYLATGNKAFADLSKSTSDQSTANRIALSKLVTHIYCFFKTNFLPVEFTLVWLY